MAALGFLLASYLLGTVPQVYLLGKLKGRDLARAGDLHQALWRMSRPLGLLGILGDVAKGPLPVAAAWWLGLELWVRAGAGVAGVLGQMWPPLLPSTGGKGNTTGLGMALALSPLPLLLALIPILASLTVRTAGRLRRGHSILSGPPSRSLPVGMLVGFASLPVTSWRLGQEREITLALLALFLAIVVRRLSAGLRADLAATSAKGRVLLNRFLYDRSFL